MARVATGEDGGKRKGNAIRGWHDFATSPHPSLAADCHCRRNQSQGHSQRPEGGSQKRSIYQDATASGRGELHGSSTESLHGTRSLRSTTGDAPATTPPGTRARSVSDWRSRKQPPGSHGDSSSLLSSWALSSDRHHSSMGSEPYQIEILVDQDQYTAGDCVTGRVHWTVYEPRKKKTLEQLRGVRLLVEGYEKVGVVIRQTTTKGRPTAAAGAEDDSDVTSDYEEREEPNDFDESTHTLIKRDYPLVQFRTPVEPGHYEYPFEWWLPADLPSSFWCTSGNTDERTSRGGYCQIRYTVTASLWLNATSNRFAAQSSQCYRASASIQITAANPTSVIPAGRPLIVEPEDFNISTCCLWGKEKMRLGWELSTDVARPNERLELRVTGNNESKIRLRHMLVKWEEIVSWRTRGGHSDSITFPAESLELPVHDLSRWQPMDPSLSQVHYRLLADSLGPVAQFVLPSSMHDTYDGRLLQVHHVLTVQAIPASSCCSSTAEVSCQVPLTRPYGPALTGGRQRQQQQHAIPPPCASPPRAPIVPTAPSEEEMCAARSDVSVLTDSCCPTAEEVAPIPEAAAVLVENNNDPVTLLWADQAGRQFGVEQLKSLVRDQPENLSALLEDPAWSAFVKTLSPSQFGATVLAAGPEAAADVAHTLALRMGSAMKCSHVVACLKMLPDPERKDVMWQTASLASDLQENQALLEQELLEVPTPEKVCVERDLVRADSKP